MRVVITLIAVVAFAAGCTVKKVAVETHPTDNAPETIKQSKIIVSDNHLAQGKKLYYQGKYNQAIKHFVRSIANDRENWETYYYLGLAQQKQGRYDRSIGSFNNSDRYAPPEREILAKISLALGESWEEEGYLDRATEKYSQAARLNPKLDSARVALERVKGKTLKVEKEKQSRQKSKEAH
jgi:tetratricopeptide (TPR) repeat protein